MENETNIRVQPHNHVETPLTNRGHYVLLNLVKYYSRFIATENKNILLLDLLKDAVLLDRLRKGEEDYIDVPIEEKNRLLQISILSLRKDGQPRKKRKCKRLDMETRRFPHSFQPT